MPRHRYRPLEETNPDAEQLPLDTICTILVRQSTAVQAERHVHSAELNPQDLEAVAKRCGFASDQIRLVDDDMGIGAYSTKIEDRPGLKKWLFEDLPRGVSRVVLVSHEDRLFRDRDETEHNRFIAQAAQHGGWAICGQTVYNFRRKFDQDHFRWECRAGKEYVEGHIKGRLHPANQRAAMRGQYAGGMVPMGYVVDYDPRSPTFKRFVLYEPHALLVVERVFQYFARLPNPSVMAVARHWECEGLAWPFYGPEVDPRIVRIANGTRVRDELRGGYMFDWKQAQHILTDVVYLGWRVRKRQVAWDTAANAPLVCHPALVDGDLFWWCYDQVDDERPPWAPPRSLSLPVVRRSRPPRCPAELSADDVRFLAHGRVRCAVHRHALAVRTYDGGRVGLLCNGYTQRVYAGPHGCAQPSVKLLEGALVQAFVEQLTLDEEDMQLLAQLAERRMRSGADTVRRLRQAIAEHQAVCKRAMELAVRDENRVLAEELLGQARDAKRLMAEREAELAAWTTEQPISSQAWLLGQGAAALAERIRSTFQAWSRSAQARVIGLALDDAVVGYVARQVVGIWMRWHGGGESRAEVRPTFGRQVVWTEEERALLRDVYERSSWEALLRMFPGRSHSAIKTVAFDLGLRRPHSGETSLSSEVVRVIAPPVVANTMVAYGFPLAQGGAGGRSFDGQRSGRRTKSARCASTVTCWAWR